MDRPAAEAAGGGFAAASARTGMRKPQGKKQHQVPPDVRPQLMRALELDTAGKTAEAEELYRAVLKADPHNFAALNRRAVLCALRGELVEALRLIQAAVRANPKAGGTAPDMGFILEQLGRPREAKVVYERALALRPDQAVPHNGRGVALCAEGDRKSTRLNSSHVKISYHV